MSGHKSVLMRPTGRFNSAGEEEREPIFLSQRHTAGKSIFVKGRQENGLDLRYNAAGDSVENASGYQILIDTMTYIKQQESKQVYYELAGKKPSDYVPIAVGDGAWASNILTRRVYTNAGDFESGLTRQGSHDARMTQADVSMDSVTLPTFIWDNGVEYNLAEIEQALTASNWDIIAAKHASRMKMWQLGIQETTFLGTKSGSMQGLFINTALTANTSFITSYISSLSAAGFLAFVQGLIATYWTETNSTVLPTHFVIPMVDYLGLMTMVPGTVGNYAQPMLNYLMEAFTKLCGPDFKIMGCAYADKTVANARRGYDYNTYALYRHDAESLRRDIPVDFTVTQPNSINNFNFMDVAYAQVTGVGFYKPLETLLFTF